MQLKTTAPLTAVLLILLVSAPAVAAPADTTDSSEDEEDEGDTIVNIDLGEVVDAINNLIHDFGEFTDNWDDTMKELLKAVFFGPFLALLKYLVTQLIAVLTHTPDVYPNPAIEEIWQLSYLVTISLSGLAFAFAGILYMVGPLLGVPYSKVRKILPRIILALVFASVSLPLLQYAVDLSNTLTVAFRPDGLETSIGEMYGISVSLVIVWLVNSLLMLVVVLMFVFKNVYIFFTAAISPLLALGWSLPKVKRYSDTFIAGFWTALAMGPLDMLVLRLSFALMQGNGTTIIQSLQNWIYGMASLALLIWVPLQLYGASQAAVGQAYVVAQGVKQRISKHRRKKSRDKFRQKKLKALRQNDRGQQRRRRRR